ncbi:MAG TPA: nuclear transport factor 2 family protein [Chthoniobacterales bacterium]
MQPADAQLRQQLDLKYKKFDEAMNMSDAAAAAAFFTEDAVLVTDAGPVYGREAIEKHYANLFETLRVIDHLTKADSYSPRVLGTANNEACSNGKWSLTLQTKAGDPVPLKGYWSEVYLRAGDAWKVRMQTWNVTPASAPYTQSSQ